VKGQAQGRAAGEAAGRAAIAALCALGVTVAGCHDSPTSPAMSATCEAQPSTGAAPLAVRFLLSVAGAQGPFAIAVAYGDGTAGADPDAVHTYTAAGRYAASFTVSTATQSARCAATVTVAVQPPPPPNQPPQAVYKTSPRDVSGVVSGKAPFDVTLNMCASSEPENDPLYFLIDFEGDGHWDSRGTTGAACRKTNTYAAGTYHPLLCLHDMGPTGEPLHDDQCRSYTVVANP
jgi:hypothetical protein